MSRLFGFSALTFWALTVATTGCSSDPSDGANGAAGSSAQGGNDSIAGSTSGNANVSGGAGPGGSNVTAQGGNGPTTGGVGGSATVSGGAGLGGSGHTMGGTSLGASGGSTSGGSLQVGTFFLLSLRLGGNEQNVAYQVYATFYTANSPSCPSQTFGNCVVHSNCSSVANSVSAGTLTVTSPATTSLPANNVTMTPNADNTYDNGALSGLFSGNEVLHISASGATVPAFSTDLTAPLVLLIDAPTPDSSGVIGVNTSNDLVINFSRGTAGVALSAQNIGATSSNWLDCTSAPGANSLTIPKAALALVEGPIYLLTQATKQIVAGDCAVSAGVVMNAYTSDKQHPVMLEFK